MIKRLAAFLRSLDRLLVVCCLGATGMGIFLLFGIYRSGMASQRQVITQAAGAALGVVGAAVLSRFDYRTLAGLYKLYIPAGVFLLLLTYVVGIRRYEYIDDRAWLPIPFIGVTFQPSELLKLAFILSFALHLETQRGSVNTPHSLLRLCLHGAVPVVLVMLQGDDGTALVFLFIFIVMMFTAGVSWKYIASAFAAAVASLPVIWFFLMNPDQKKRVITTLYPASDPLGAGWQQYLASLSIGSGQVWGKGVLGGGHNYVPEIHNDFIFAFAGEALGFVGALGIVLLLAVICLRILTNADGAPDPLGRFICVGVFAMLAFQITVNLGMCLWLLPVVGLTLPFLSAGGTSVVISFLAVGLVLSVHSRSRVKLFSDG
jgi:rod shape determining protein RodA